MEIQQKDNDTGNVYEKDPQTLSEVIKLLEKLNMSQQVTATLSLPMVNMISSDDRSFVCGKKGHIGHHCPAAQCCNYNILVTLPRTANRQFPHEKHLITMIDHSPTHTIATTAETGHTPSITDTGKETILTGQDHTINLYVTEFPVSTGYMHPSLYHTTTATCNIHPQADTLECTPKGTPCTVTDATHP